MTYTDRRINAQLITPNNETVSFDYIGDYSVSFEKRVAENDAISGNGPGDYVDQGRKELKLPMEIVFHGDNSDIEAKNFLGYLAQEGVFVLFHPFFNRIEVKVKGTPTLRGNDISYLGVYYINVEFVEHTVKNFPVIESFGVDNVNSNIENSLSAFGDILPSDGLLGEAKMVFNDINQFIADTTNMTAEEISGLEALNNSINNQITDLVTNPFLLLSNVRKLASYPSTIKNTLSKKLKGYYDYFSNSENIESNPTRTVFKAAVLLSSIDSMLNSDIAIDTRKSIIENLNKLEEQSVKIDSEMVDFEFDVVDEYQQAMTNGKNIVLSNLSNAKTELTYTVERNSDLIEILNNIYPTNFEEQIDEVIILNNLSADEIFNVAKGKEILYYV